MPKFIAFLRAMNVGGRRLKMDELRSFFEQLGYAQVETFIASGNVIFSSPNQDEQALAKEIEEHLRKSLGYEVATFLRAPAELAAIAEYKPFADELLQTAAALSVGFLAHPLDETAVNALMTLNNEMDDFHHHQREIYWLSRQKQSESTISLKALEKLLRAQATFRGVNTIVRLTAKYQGK